MAMMILNKEGWIMKRIIIFAAMTAALLTACQPELIVEETRPGTEPVVFTATTESAATKTALSKNGDEYDVVWQEGDAITIRDGSSRQGVYSTTSTTSHGVFTLSSGYEVMTPPYQAWYPSTIYNNGSLKLPDTQTYTEGNISRSPMYAESSTASLSFKNLCGIIRLDISTNQSNMQVEKIVLTADQGMSGFYTLSGDAAVVSGTAGVTLQCSPKVPIGSEPTSFYVSVPEGNYTNFKIKVITYSGHRQTKIANKTIKVTRSKITPITLSFNDLSREAIDLSPNETANCYIVSESEMYKFRAMVKGNGAADLSGIGASTDNIYKANVVWATYGTHESVTIQDIIQNVYYSGGYVYFTAADPFREGNVLIAVRDASNNILWSWHIWFEKDDLKALAQTYPSSGAVMMDRNLGALSNKHSDYNSLDFGLLYEWGRKDPFPNRNNQQGTWYDAALTWGPLSPSSITLEGLNIASSIAKPAAISSGGINGATWEGAEKNIFDPCPAGWKVPAPEVFSGITNTGVWVSGQGGTFNLNGGTTAWYPAAGLYGHGHIQHYSQGEGSYIYTTTTAYAKSFQLTASIPGGMRDCDSYWACSVRCVKDDASPSYMDPSNYTDLSSGGTANCYQIRSKGDYKFKATVKGNGAANIANINKETQGILKAELLWASYGTTTAPAADAFIKRIFYKDGYVCFSTADTYREGNAVVVVKDNYGNIAWSWHLWFESDDLDAKAIQYTNTRYLMDRNLGATNNYYVSSNSYDYGLLYQWGRKDPFLNAPDRTYYGSTEPAVYGAAREAKNQRYSLEEAIRNPNHYPFTYNDEPWMSSSYSSYALWATSKTIFDPCPPGWKIPGKDYVKSSSLYSNFKTTTPTTGGIPIYTGYGTLWFPDAGYRQGAATKNGSNTYIQGAGIIQHRGEGAPYIRVWLADGILWRDTFGGNLFGDAYDKNVALLSSPWFYYGTYLDNACSVRCEKE